MKTLKKISLKNAEALNDAKMKKILGGMARTTICSVTCPNGEVLGQYFICPGDCSASSQYYFLRCTYEGATLTAYCSDSTLV
ncbi:MAG: TIGR04149 family rSAM-modified RiPP [Rikenellaceae bacterium]